MTKEAYGVVEQMLRDAVSSAKTPDEMNKNLRMTQTIAMRMLAVLIFNAARGDADKLDQMFEQVGLGIKSELDQIIEASKDQANLTSIDASFGQANEH